MSGPPPAPIPTTDGGRPPLAELLESRRLPRPEAPGRWLFLHHDPRDRLAGITLRHSLAGYRHPPAFERVEPHVWALEFKAPGITRFEYELELIARDGATRFVRDPLNPLTCTGPLSTRSVALGLGYAAPLVAAPTPRRLRGRLARHEMPIMVEADGTVHDGETWIWEARGCRRDEPAPLLVFLDGPEYVQFAAARRVLENLVGGSALPPCRAVFVPPADRDRHYSADSAMADFLADVLPELLERRVPVPRTPAERVLVGASLGGLAALHAHCTRPGFFGSLVLQSGSFFQPATDAMEARFDQFDRICRFVGSVLEGRVTAPPVPVRMTCGIGGENLANNRAMLTALRRAGCDADLALVPDAHTWTAWRDSLAPALVALVARG